MKKFIIIAFALMLCMALVTPAAVADIIPTKVNVNKSGNADELVVKMKWEETDADTDKAGIQIEGKPGEINAAGEFDRAASQSNVNIWAVVGNLSGTFDQIDEVYADIWHPTFTNEFATSRWAELLNEEYDEWCGSFKVEIELDTWGGSCANVSTKLTKIREALLTGNVTINWDFFNGMGITEVGPLMSGSTFAEWLAAYTTYSNPLLNGTVIQEVWRELEQCQAGVFTDYTTFNIHQPAGWYDVAVIAVDGGVPTPALCNEVEYLGVDSFIADFGSELDYGVIDFGEWETVHGDRDMLTLASPTVWNNGNTYINLNVSQDSMGMGYNVDGGSFDKWNVLYSVQMGDGSYASTHYYYHPNDPVSPEYSPGDLHPPATWAGVTEVTSQGVPSASSAEHEITIDWLLYPCHPEKINFDIIITKDLTPPEEGYSGDMTLTAENVPYEECCTRDAQGVIIDPNCPACNIDPPNTNPCQDCPQI